MIRVGINGYGTIGKRVADAIMRQPDMKLIGIVKVTPDYTAKNAQNRGIKIYTLKESVNKFKEKNIEVEGTIEELLEQVDVIVDATPGGKGREYKPIYDRHGVHQIFQGGEKADIADVSFNTLCNYDNALGRKSIRVVSCNTTGLLRSICSLQKAIKVKKVFATIVRRGADPKETKRGPINAIKLDPPQLPSHHALDVRTVLPDLDITTVAVVVPTTLMHVHIVQATTGDQAHREDVISIFENTPRIILVNSAYGFKSTADIVEFFRDYGRKRYDIPELVIWEDSITVNDKTITWIQAVHQESIVVPENIDAIRATTSMASVDETLKITNSTLGILRGRLF